MLQGHPLHAVKPFVGGPWARRQCWSSPAPTAEAVHGAQRLSLIGESILGTGMSQNLSRGSDTPFSCCIFDACSCPLASRREPGSVDAAFVSSAPDSIGTSSSSERLLDTPGTWLTADAAFSIAAIRSGVSKVDSPPSATAMTTFSSAPQTAKNRSRSRPAGLSLATNARGLKATSSRPIPTSETPSVTTIMQKTTDTVNQTSSLQDAQMRCPFSLRKSTPRVVVTCGVHSLSSLRMRRSVDTSSWQASRARGFPGA